MAEESVKGPFIETRVGNLLATVYGPYAFGIVSLIIIWFAIVAPQLEKQSVDHKANLELMKTLQTIVQTSEITSRTMERTSVVQESTTKTLSSLIDKIQELKSNVE